MPDDVEKESINSRPAMYYYGAEDYTEDSRPGEKIKVPSSIVAIDYRLLSHILAFLLIALISYFFIVTPALSGPNGTITVILWLLTLLIIMAVSVFNRLRKRKFRS